MTKLMWRTTNSMDDNADCDWAVIDIDKEYASKILSLMNVVKIMKALDEYIYSIERFTYFACYSNGTLRAIPAIEALIEERNTDTTEDNVDPILLPGASLANLDEEPTACVTMVITDNSCQWQCQPKYGDATIQTPEIPRTMVEQWLTLFH